MLERIDAVDVEQVRELAAELFDPARLSVAGVGPDEEDFRAAIGPLGASVAVAAAAPRPDAQAVAR
jgi:hypothetical protein